MKDKKILLIMFLLGIFIGALDSGIVSPARTIIANSLSVSQNNSVWVITIYTLAYAVSMPISGKLSDRYGKKKLYTISIFIFGLGSLLCGLSNYFGSFSLLLTSRCYWQVQIQYFWQVIIQFFVFSRGKICPHIF